MRLTEILAAGGVALLVTASGPVHAALTDAQQSLIQAAMSQPTSDAAAQAIRPVFAANVPQVVEIATEAVRIEPAYCGAVMSEGAAAAPDQAVDIAASIIAIAPACETIVAEILADALEAAAGPEGDLAPAAGPAFPTPNPVGPVSTTAENPSTDVFSPTTP